MIRAHRYVVLCGCLLVSCDDGVLRAFEPSRSGSGSAGKAGTSAEAGSGAGTSGGSSGSMSEGGVGGQSEGGAPLSGTGPGEPSSPWLIDDFEDGDVRAKEPRGWWYPVNDGTGTQGFGIEPINDGTGSVYALRTHGSGFHDWGSALGVNLVGDGTPLSAPSNAKLCFQARVETGTTPLVQVHFLSDQHYTHDVSLTESWSRYCLLLSEFVSLNGAVLVPSDVIALQFFFAPESRFELWLDDVEIEP